MLTYSNLKKGTVSATEVKCITDALLVTADNKSLQETNLHIEMEDAGEVTSHQF